MIVLGHGKQLFPAWQHKSTKALNVLTFNKLPSSRCLHYVMESGTVITNPHSPSTLLCYFLFSCNRSLATVMVEHSFVLVNSINYGMPPRKNSPYFILVENGLSVFAIVIVEHDFAFITVNDMN